MGSNSPESVEAVGWSRARGPFVGLGFLNSGVPGSLRRAERPGGGASGGRVGKNAAAQRASPSAPHLSAPKGVYAEIFRMAR